VSIVIIVAVVAALLLGHHDGHGHANYRHARAQGRRRSPSLHLGAHGAWVSIPGSFGTRIGHRL
jgi:hypothetical protein